MPLDPQVAKHYEGKSFASALGRLPIEKIREGADGIYNDKVVLVELPKVVNMSIPGPAGDIQLRLYYGKDMSSEADAELPVMLYFHGGAFVMHNIASHDNLCRKLAKECGCLVVSVEYRLAPEHPYPAALEDAYAVLLWAANHIKEYDGDPEKLMTAGDSAGATISAALSFYTRDHHGPDIRLQVLYYGTYGCLSLDESESVRLYANGEYVLPRDMLDAGDDLYGQGADPKDPYYMPGTCEDAGLETRTLVVTAEFDPLRDDGETFAEQLKDAGSPVVMKRMDGMMHGFMLLWNKFDRTSEIFELTAQAVNEL